MPNPGSRIAGTSVSITSTTASCFDPPPGLAVDPVLISVIGVTELAVTNLLNVAVVNTARGVVVG